MTTPAPQPVPGRAPTPRSQTPRIPPVTSPDDALLETLEQTGRRNGEFQRVFTTLAHHPSLLKRTNVLGGLFYRRSELDVQLREFVILRVAWRVGCAYEYAQHLVIAREFAVSSELMEAAIDQAPAPDASFAAIRSVVDEVLMTDDVSDETWARLASFSTEAQILELLALIGFYRLLGTVLNAVRVVPESDLPEG